MSYLTSTTEREGGNDREGRGEGWGGGGGGGVVCVQHDSSLCLRPVHIASILVPSGKTLNIKRIGVICSARSPGVLSWCAS